MQNPEQVSRQGVASAQTTAKALHTLNRFHPQRLIDDDLLSDDASDDITQHGIHVWNSQSAQDVDRNFSHSARSVMPNIHPTDDFSKLRQLIDQGDVDASRILAERLCKSSSHSSNKSASVSSVSDQHGPRIANEVTQTNVQCDVEKSIDCQDGHPLGTKIRCLLMNTFYCIPNDSACEETLRLEIEKKKTEWIDYRKKISAIIHSEIVRWYLEADHAHAKVSLVPVSESTVLKDLRGAPTKYPDPDVASDSADKPRPLRTSTLRRPKVMHRNHGGRLNSPAPHKCVRSPTGVNIPHNEMEINLVVKALRSMEEVSDVRFSVGVRGDSFPQDLSKRITMILNERKGVNPCPISATFDLYFCVIYRP